MRNATKPANIASLSHSPVTTYSPNAWTILTGKGSFLTVTRLRLSEASEAPAHLGLCRIASASPYPRRPLANARASRKCWPRLAGIFSSSKYRKYA
eukprot:9022322-Lingulodinium_polyedra.AAC.1